MPKSLDQKNDMSVGQITFRQLADAMPQMVWSTQPDGAHDYYNARWYEFTGAPVGSTDGEGWNGMFHPEDQERAWAIWRSCLETGEPYEIEYRLRHHSGDYRWTLGRALPVRSDDGSIIRWVGTCTDINEHKQTAQMNAVLSRELSHRIKNIFAVIGGIIGISARQFPTMETLARQLQARVSALGRAHDYARPHSEDSAPHSGPSSLSELLRQLMVPYPVLDEGRLTIEGDSVLIDDRGATPIGLAFHELATNSMKYGAMSSPDGRVAIQIDVEDGLVAIKWHESGGPPVTEPEQTGFGTQLTEIAITAQLGGTIDRVWAKDGLCVNIRVLEERLSRS
ncbi:sensor histidine kinase [Erythrobacter sp. R86502]|uniref:sensor histidine kinase n=1 Tax=Erythrobacter sp. R86502 TaxID=3093846 RepID=UPI0036D236D7